MRCCWLPPPHLRLVKLIKAGAILPSFLAIMKKVLGLRSGQKFTDQKDPRSENQKKKKAATKQKGQIGETYLSTAILFWVKSHNSEFIFFLNQSDLIHRLVDFIDWLQRVKNIGIVKYLCPVCDMYIPMICIFIRFIFVSFLIQIYLDLHLYRDKIYLESFMPCSEQPGHKQQS